MRVVLNAGPSVVAAAAATSTPADPLAAFLDVKLSTVAGGAAVAATGENKAYLAFALDVATLAARRECPLPTPPSGAAQVP